MHNDQWVVRSEERLRESVGELMERVREKKRPVIDEHSERFIAASPLVCIATRDGEGLMDVSPRGDDAGFVKVLEPTTIVIPERPGNRLADTLTNILQNPQVGLLFLIPDSPEMLRINGRARVQDGPPELLRSMSARGREPKLAIVIEIDEVFVHCGRAAARSRIWERNVEWTDPRADLLIGTLVGLDAEQTQQMLADYNGTDL